MVRLRTLLIIILASLLPVTHALADARAGIDRANVEQNESFTLTIVSDAGANAQPDVSVLETDFEVGPPSSRSETRIFNGEMHRSMTWSYSLMPKRVGQLRIPAITVGNEQTAPLFVTVTAASTAVPGEAEVFVTSEVDYDETYVQAQVLVRIKIFLAVATRQPTLRNPTFSGAEVLVESAGDDKRYEAIIDERAYSVVERVIALFPQESGEIEVTPARFEARILRNGRITGRKTFDSEPLTISVNPTPPPPAEYPDAVWLPALELSLSEDWSRGADSIKAGEPLTRHVTISALGQLETQIPVLDPPAADGINVYPDKPDLTRINEDRGIRGQRRDQYALIGTRGGAVELPEVKVPWWNLDTGEWEVASLPARTIEIEAVAEPTPQVIQEPVDPATADAATEAAPAQMESAFWRRATELLAVLWLLTLVTWWWTSRAPKAPKAPAPVPPHKQQARCLKWAHMAAADGNASGVRTAMLEWASIQWPDNPPRSMGALANRVSEPLRSELIALSRQSYGPGDTTWKGDAMIKALKSFGTVDAQSVANRELLPPLTPG